MQLSLAALALSLGISSASIIPRAGCTFSLSASGGVSGTIWQLSDGQVRVNGGSGTATFTINGNQITDSNGRGCILTPQVAQFQCDSGASPTSGFSINSSGLLTYSGSTTFYACPASDTQYNIYTTPVTGQLKCVTVTLTASGCAATSTSTKPASTSTVKPASTSSKLSSTSSPKPASTSSAKQASTSSAKQASTSSPKPSSTSKPASTSSKAPSTSSSKQASTSSPKASSTSVKPASSSSSAAKTCPTTLSGSYQYPHLIIPVDSSKPSTAAGTSYFGQVTSTISSIFNFDIPTSYTGTCSLVFLFPTQSQLETSSYTFSGPGTVDFVQLSTVATTSTTYANQGSVKTDFGVKTVTPGTSTVITTFACPAGTAVSYELKSVGGTNLTYFQDYNPSPIGLYITTC